jgi:hypothetical protein
LDRPCLGNDLIDKIPPEEIGEELSSDPGERKGMNLLRRNSPKDLLQEMLNGLKGLPPQTGVMLFQDLVLVVHDDGIRTDRTNINTQIKLLHSLGPSGRRLNKNTT